nr:HipA domain-containing protein [Arthrobacter sp. B2a2-09]
MEKLGIELTFRERALVFYAGRDVAGAIRIGGDPGEPAEFYEPLTDEQIAERLTLINDYALGLPWDTDSKFEGVNPVANLRSLAGLLPRRRDIFDAGPDDREMLLAHTAFNTAVGNTDAHAKNFATLRTDDGAVTIAPLYDVSTHALAPNGQLNMSLRVNDRAFQPSLTVEDLVAEGVSWGLEERYARQSVTGTLEKLAYAIGQADGSAVGENVVRFIAHGTKNLLDGKAAGIGGAHHSRRP